MKYLFFVLFFLSCLQKTLHAEGHNPIQPGDILPQKEIDSIIKENNYFYYKTLNLESPIWAGTQRLYGNHFLGKRTFKLTEKDVVHRTIVEGFPIQYQLETLFRDKMKVHSAIGGVVPHINLSFGQGISYGLDQVFSGLFGFLIPSQWIKIAKQKSLYEISYHSLSKRVLDEVLKAKLAYIDLHQRIQEFEITNYYLVHMQILALSDPEYFHQYHLIQAFTSAMGTDMAKERSQIRLAFDDLASLMGMETDDKDRTVDNLNIEDMRKFPRKPELRTESGELISSKRDFLREVIQKSIELKIVKELYKVSKMNIGIQALGGNINTDEISASSRHDAVFNFNLGYSTIPETLASVSRKRTAQIDVRNEYIKMLTAARKAYDTYTNSRLDYVEAMQSLEDNRRLFKFNVKKLIDREDITKGIPVLLGVRLLVKAEFSYTYALHEFLKAKAEIERFLLIGSSKYLKYVPGKDKILKAFQKSKVSYTKELFRNNDLAKKLAKIRYSQDLKNFLYGKSSEYDKFFTEEREKEVKGTVQSEIKTLLRYRTPIRRRRKDYFKTLEEYILKHHIYLTAEERNMLNRGLRKKRFSS